MQIFTNSKHNLFLDNCYHLILKKIKIENNYGGQCIYTYCALRYMSIAFVVCLFEMNTNIVSYIFTVHSKQTPAFELVIHLINVLC